MRAQISSLLIVTTLAALSTSAFAAENRCGWVQNPTPGNYWLDDRDGTWIIATQGSETEALGMENMGDISAGDYIKTNGYYGYACGCMKVETERNTDPQDSATGRITAIYSFKQLKITKCRADKSLPKPE